MSGGVSCSPGTLLPQWSATLDDYALDCRWSPDGLKLVASSSAGEIVLFEAGNGRVCQRWAGHDLGTPTLSWKPDSFVLASGGQDARVRCWEPGKDEPISTFPAGGDWVEQVAWSPDGSHLAWGAGRNLCMVDIASGKITIHDAHPATVHDLHWSPSEKLRLATCTAGGIWFWKPGRAASIRHFAWQGAGLTVRWSPDRRYIAMGDQDATVHFWFIKDGTHLRMAGFPGKIRLIDWASTSRRLATASGTCLAIWDCTGRGPEGRPPTMLEGTNAPYTALAYHPAGRILASGDAGGTIILWEPEKTSRFVSVARRLSGVSVIQWSPDGQRIAVGFENGDITVFEPI